jgi:hypothetical protein
MKSGADELLAVVIADRMRHPPEPGCRRGKSSEAATLPREAELESMLKATEFPPIAGDDQADPVVQWGLTKYIAAGATATAILQARVILRIHRRTQRCYCRHWVD